MLRVLGVAALWWCMSACGDGHVDGRADAGGAGGSGGAGAVGGSGGSSGTGAVGGTGGFGGSGGAGGVGGSAGSAGTGPLTDASINDAQGVLDADVDPTDGGGETMFSTDRTEFFGAPRCSGRDYVLCEDFESVAVGQKPDSNVWQTDDDRIVIDDTRAARGSRSLHVETHSGESVHFARTTRIVPALSSRMWGRMFFWTDAARPTQFNHWTTIEATGVHPAGGTARVRFGGIHVPDFENRIDFNYDIWGGRPAGFHEVGYELNGTDTPDETWHCFEWMFDAPAREARFFWDGVEQDRLHADDAIDGIDLDFPTFDGLNIGMAIYQPIDASAWNVWIDEVAVDDSRIGCSR